MLDQFRPAIIVETAGEPFNQSDHPSRRPQQQRFLCFKLAI
jgi:hypothetical protein